MNQASVGKTAFLGLIYFLRTAFCNLIEQPERFFHAATAQILYSVHAEADEQV